MYQYKTVISAKYDTIGERRLNEYASDGWRLKCVVPVGDSLRLEYIFERKIY